MQGKVISVFALRDIPVIVVNSHRAIPIPALTEIVRLTALPTNAAAQRDTPELIVKSPLVHQIRARTAGYVLFRDPDISAPVQRDTPDLIAKLLRAHPILA